MANCTQHRLMKLPSHFLVQLFPNYTQKHVITYNKSKHKKPQKYSKSGPAI